MILPLAGLALGLAWWAIFRAWTARPAWRDAADRSLGLSLELLLYSESPGLMGRVLGDLAKVSLRLSRLLLGPSLLSLLAMLAVLAPLHWLCGMRPPAVGEAFLVSLQTSAPRQWSWALPPELSVEGPGIQVGDVVYWRLRAQKPGPHELRLEAGSQSWVAPLCVGDSWCRPHGGELRVHYPPRDVWLGDHFLPLWLALLLWGLFWSLLGMLSSAVFRRHDQ